MPPVAEPLKKKTTTTATNEIPLMRGSLQSLLQIPMRVKRQQDLLKLIQFDLSIYELFEMAPRNAYQLYMRSVSTTLSQQSSQTGEESGERASQCEDWLIVDRWTQAPPSQLVESALDSCSLPWILPDPLSKERKKKYVEYTPRLGAFLDRATTLMESLILERYGSVTHFPLSPTF